MLGAHSRGFELVFAIGTSSLFPDITALSEFVEERLEMGAVAACEALWAARGQWERQG
ncbi:hypothetical protein [Stigmatella aurantiaca]|uniref:hypothetical protein n=1 Tax=Stigmatella aurantiaca TaxID=41 RepID=UPI0002F50E98|nr:hypothetical protein [Stigmatella aurantiaca]